eukprot:GEMP01007765.1.p1 GENE.GEMP01007765.1~~GEMP01007765.1.p1  ORF type:complete len:1054 (+),score=294.90 GEMP01007765.1:76-3237(+)
MSSAPVAATSPTAEPTQVLPVLPMEAGTIPAAVTLVALFDEYAPEIIKKCLRSVNEMVPKLVSEQINRDVTPKMVALQEEVKQAQLTPQYLVPPKPSNLVVAKSPNAPRPPTNQVTQPRPLSPPGFLDPSLSARLRRVEHRVLRLTENSAGTSTPRLPASDTVGRHTTTRGVWCTTCADVKKTQLESNLILDKLDMRLGFLEQRLEFLANKPKMVSPPLILHHALTPSTEGGNRGLLAQMMEMFAPVRSRLDSLDTFCAYTKSKFPEQKRIQKYNRDQMSKLAEALEKSESLMASMQAEIDRVKAEVKLVQTPRVVFESPKPARIRVPEPPTDTPYIRQSIIHCKHEVFSKLANNRDEILSAVKHEARELNARTEERFHAVVDATSCRLQEEIRLANMRSNTQLERAASYLKKLLQDDRLEVIERIYEKESQWKQQRAKQDGEMEVYKKHVDARFAHSNAAALCATAITRGAMEVAFEQRHAEYGRQFREVTERMEEHEKKTVIREAQLRTQLEALGSLMKENMAGLHDAHAEFLTRTEETAVQVGEDIMNIQKRIERLKQDRGGPDSNFVSKDEMGASIRQALSKIELECQKATSRFASAEAMEVGLSDLYNKISKVKTEHASTISSMSSALARSARAVTDLERDAASVREEMALGINREITTACLVLHTGLQQQQEQITSIVSEHGEQSQTQKRLLGNVEEIQTNVASGKNELMKLHMELRDAKAEIAETKAESRTRAEETVKATIQNKQALLDIQADTATLLQEIKSKNDHMQEDLKMESAQSAEAQKRQLELFMDAMHATKRSLLTQAETTRTHLQNDFSAQVAACREEISATNGVVMENVEATLAKNGTLGYEMEVKHNERMADITAFTTALKDKHSEFLGAVDDKHTALIDAWTARNNAAAEGIQHKHTELCLDMERKHAALGESITRLEQLVDTKTDKTVEDLKASNASWLKEMKMSSALALEDTKLKNSEMINDIIKRSSTYGAMIEALEKDWRESVDNLEGNVNVVHHSFQRLETLQEQFDDRLEQAEATIQLLQVRQGQNIAQ